MPETPGQSAPPTYSDSLSSDTTWWNAHERGQKPTDILCGLIDTMKNRQGVLFENTKKCIAIYQWGGDARRLGMIQDPPLEDTAVAMNAAQNIIETVHAKICKSRIMPMALTSGGGPYGGGYAARHRAKQMSQAVEGEFEENRAEEVKEDVVMDALVTAHGGGIAKVSEYRGRVCIQHVPTEDIWFDESEVRRRRPRCCYQIDRIDKYVLMELAKEWAEGEEESDSIGTLAERLEVIRKAGTEKIHVAQAASGREGEHHQIEVYEAWHLPSCDVEEANDNDDEPYSGVQDDPVEKRRRKGHDGRHVIAIKGATLVDEPWDYDFFPFAMYVPRKRRRSIWGLSLMFDYVAAEREYEKLQLKVQTWQQKGAMSGLIAPKAAKVNVREFTAGVIGAGFLAEYEGQIPPTQFIIDPVPPGTFQYMDSIPQRMRAMKGVSDLSAVSQLPAGLQDASGKALQVYEDFEAERLLPYHRALERFIVDLSWLVVHTADCISKKNPEYSTRYRDKYFFKDIKWAALLEDKKNLIIRVFPVSDLAKQPAARFQQLTELLNYGAITAEQFKRLYSMPDLEAENELDTSDTDIIDRNLDRMVLEGKYSSPQSFDALETIKVRTGKFINLCRQYDVPDSRMKLLHDYVADAQGLIDQAKAKAQADAVKQQAAMAAASVPPQGPPPNGAPPPMAAAA